MRTITVIGQVTDNLFTIASANFPASGYASYFDYIDLIRTANPSIKDWTASLQNVSVRLPINR